MSRHPSTDDYVDEHDSTVPRSEALFAILLTAGSALLVGYVVGRTSHEREMLEAFRRLAESPALTEVTIPTL